MRTPGYGLQERFCPLLCISCCRSNESHQPLFQNLAPHPLSLTPQTLCTDMYDSAGLLEEYCRTESSVNQQRYEVSNDMRRLVFVSARQLNLSACAAVKQALQVLGPCTFTGVNAQELPPDLGQAKMCTAMCNANAVVCGGRGSPRTASASAGSIPPQPWLWARSRLVRCFNSSGSKCPVFGSTIAIISHLLLGEAEEVRTDAALAAGVGPGAAHAGVDCPVASAD